MRLEKLYIQSRFKNLDNLTIDFSDKEGLSVLIGNNGSGKSNIIEALSSIFSGLFDSTKNPIFSYKIEYSIRTYIVSISFDFPTSTYICTVNGVVDRVKNEYLPKQVISCYSGEESRLWDEYFFHFYKKYIDAIKGETIPNQPLVFINKYYWDIALLTFHFYDFTAFTDIRDFCKDDLKIQTINYIKFTFDTRKITAWAANPVVNFVKAINPDNLPEIQISLTELKDKLNFITNEEDFFNYLTAAFMPKDDKLITKIEFNFNNNLTTSSLSEGEKKLILVQVILEVIGDEDSLILLDEPDSHIHISKKEDLQKLLNKYTNRENILTTHSPTLTHCFDNKHIIMLAKKANNDTDIIAKEKQEIVHELTNGMWSYMEQNLFLNTNKDILLVEGKSDETFIAEALKQIQIEELNEEPNPINHKYQNLDFSFMPCGGASGVELMLGKFVPQVNQTIIAFFDGDSAGWKGINQILGEENKWNTQNYINPLKKSDIWICSYPRRRGFRGSNYNIEDYFSKPLLNKMVFKGFKGLDSIRTKNAVKRELEKDCKEGNLTPSDFKYFKKLFDYIIVLKNK